MNETFKKNINKTKKFLFGSLTKKGFIYKLFMYLLLSAIGFIFLYPILSILANSFKSLDDLLSPMVNWIPRKFYFDNYEKAYKTLDFFPTLFKSLSVTLLPALLQTIVCSIVGYGLAKFKFVGKKIVMALIIVAYILPSQVIMVPKYVFFNSLHLTNNVLSIILPALFAQGLNSSIFVFIFYQFFKMVPVALDEAASVDGAKRLSIFIHIDVPLSIPAYITSFLFSFVWYWNETYLSSIFLGTSIPTLQLNLIAFNASFTNSGFGNINEAIKDAGTILVILPLIIIYLICQRHFVEGIDKVGLAGGQ